MKRKILIPPLFLALLLIGSVQAQAQTNPLVFGSEVSRLIPLGTLGDRFKPSTGYSVYAGYKTSPKTIWTGKLEYMKFEKLNMDKLELTQSVLVGINKMNFKAPLSKIKMDLEITGMSAGVKYKMIDAGILQSNINLGFGFYRWTFHRAPYDSVSVDTSSVAGQVKNYNLVKNVPANAQQDWSCGFSAGVELVLEVAGPVSITVAGDYKNVVGELWQALALNIESVSSFQMFDLRGGIRIKL